VIPSDIIVGHIEQESQGQVASLYGSWLSFVEWDGSRYWDITQPAELPQRYSHAPVHHARCCSFLPSVPESDRLPSDCSFRSDIILMKEGQMLLAQDQKTAIEERQRQDRRLRSAAAKS
jgi:hypothetical protein